MEHSPWYEINWQREKAIENPVTSLDDLKDGFIEPFFGELFDDPKIPLSYYTKPCAWASDYPLTYRRAMVYLNPNEGHLADYSLEEYAVAEFGCTYETFEKLVEDGWLVVLLDDRSEYDLETKTEISDLFDNLEVSSYGFKPRPRYVNLVDVALGAGVIEQSNDDLDDYVRASGADHDFVDIDATIEEAMKSEPWAHLEGRFGDLYGVGGRKRRKYVTERALKLRLVGDALDREEFRKIASNIETLVESGVDDENLVRPVYTAWNHVGTPIFYSDQSGDTDIGPGPANLYPERVKEILKSHIEFNEPNRLEDLTDTVTEKVVPRAMGNLPKQEIWFEQSAGGADVSDVLSLPPSTDASLSELRTSRAEAHHRYYNGVREALQQKIEHSDDEDREDLVDLQNSNVERKFRSVGVSAKLGKMFGWAGIGTDIVTLLPVFERTAPAASVGAGMGKVVTNWWKTRQPEEIEAIPRPTYKENINLGRINSWRVPYREADGVAADGGQFGMDLEPGTYVSQWEIE